MFEETSRGAGDTVGAVPLSHDDQGHLFAHMTP